MISFGGFLAECLPCLVPVNGKQCASSWHILNVEVCRFLVYFADLSLLLALQGIFDLEVVCKLLALVNS